MNYIAPLATLDRTDLATAGGKGANLGALVRAGLPVPDGFVVTTAAYTSAVTGVDLGEEGAAIRKAVQSAPVPAPLRAEILAAYAALGAGPVAVRSSATAEDLPGAAFAGQQDTYLNVVGDDALVEAVRRCWGSLWTDRAIAYRARLGIDPAEIAIAVVVQAMVDAEFAGVMFTADPVSGARDTLVVDASAGLGEAVVSGQVTPDHYLLDPAGRVRALTPGRREVVIRAVAGGGVSHAAGEPGEGLPEPALPELAGLGATVAQLFGCPQDIEWAWAHGRVALLQARPMTALPPPPLRLNRAARMLGAIQSELFPVRPYPIDMSTWIPHGPFGMMGQITRFYGVRGPFDDDVLTEVDGVVYALVPHAPRPTPRILGAPLRIASRVRRFDPARWTADPRFAAFRARVRELAAQDPTALDWHHLVGLPRRVLAALDPITELRIDYLPGAGAALRRLLVTLALLGRRRLLRELIMDTPTRTRDTNQALEALATTVRADPALAEAVATRDPSRLAAFPAFEAGLGAFLAQYGHRETTSAVLVTPPTWGADPATVLGLLTVLAADPPQPPADAGAAMAQLLAHPRLRRPARRARVLRRVERARAGLAFREDSHFAFTEPLPMLRRALLEIGSRLRDAGVLTEPQDVFHLRLEELETLADPARLPEPVARRLRTDVAARAARRAELAGVRMIDPRALYPDRERGHALLAGTPAGGGTASGPVKIIRDAAEFTELRTGDVLVCPYTNPAWTPLFARAAAVVVDTGGAASHAAIVAREYGIPAVMGTGTATSTLAEGRWVTVDGDTGRITATAPAPPR